MKFGSTRIAIGITLALAKPVSAQVVYTPIHVKEVAGRVDVIQAARSKSKCNI